MGLFVFLQQTTIQELLNDRAKFGEGWNYHLNTILIDYSKDIFKTFL